MPEGRPLPMVTGSASARADNSSVPLLSVRNLQTYFFPDEGVVKAVDGASFDVEAGKTLGIVGESGCGKSVTARSILRIVERPGRIVGGEILLNRGAGDGRWESGLGVGSQGSGARGGTIPPTPDSRLPSPVLPAPGSRSPAIDLARLQADGRQMREIRGGEISLVFQEPMTSFSPVHTVGDQIVEAIRLHLKLNKQDARARAIELLRMVGIPRPEGRVDEYAYQLSGGLRQRAMIAMALAADPKLLIADEPTTALDVTTQAQILELLRELQERNHMAIMLITHDLGVIAEMADEVVVMYLGRVVEEGPVDDIFYAPKHPYTRALLRSIPSVQSEARIKLPTISGSIPHPYNRPVGCPFHPRCPDFMPGTCDTREPALMQVDRQGVSCFLYGEGIREGVGDDSREPVAGRPPGDHAGVESAT